MSKYEHQLQPEKIMTGKKGTVIWPAMFFEPPEKITTGKKGTVILLKPFATHVTFYFYYVCT
jgi:hypothetical protein